MSLDVTPALLAQAEQGEVDQAAFLACVRDSLPYAWDTISTLAAELQRGRDGGRPFVDNQVPPRSEQARGQLLRALASDAIRGALERHFSVTLAFQNCHRVAVFPPGARNGDGRTAVRYRQFTSARAQLLNQSPRLRDC